MARIRFEQLPSLMDKRASQFDKAAEAIVQAAATVGGRAFAREMPVDTGRARSNVVATLSSEFQGVIPPYSPGTRLGKEESSNLNAALAQHQSVVRRFNIRAPSTIFFTNNVPYVPRLNSPLTPSRQTTPGFVQRAAQEARDFLRSIRRVYATTRPVSGRRR